MGPTVIDTNPATVSSSSFLTTGIWTKLQGKERFSYLFFHSLGSGLADLSFFLLISKEVIFLVLIVFPTQECIFHITAIP